MKSLSRPPRRATISVTAASLIVFGLLGALPANADNGTCDNTDDDTVTVDLQGINDFHGRIESEDDVPGAARLASAVEETRADNEDKNGNDDTLFMAAGDNFGGSTFTTLINDENPAVEVLNEMGLDVSSVGNHEFDEGVDTLRQRMDGDEDYEKIDYDLLGANVEGADPPFEGHEIYETDSGIEVGVIGMVTPTVPSLVSPDGIEGLEFADMAETAENEVEEVKDDGADIVTIAIHEGVSEGDGVYDSDTDFGKFVQKAADLGVTAIFSGHTHKKYEEAIERSDEPDMPVLQTGSYTDNLGKVSVDIDCDGNEIDSVESEMIPLEDQDVLEDNEVVENVEEIVDDAVDEAEERGKEVVGQTGGDLNRAVKPDGEEENRGGESTVSNLIADAQLEEVIDKDDSDDPPELALMNPGGVRSDLEYDSDVDGDVTFKEVQTMQPFGNTLETFELTGEQIVEALEQQWQPEDAQRPYLKLGVSDRLNYTFDPEADQGEHITDVLFDGEPLDEDKTFKVVANNFLAAGGDNFTVLDEGSDYSDTGMNDLEAIIDFFEEKGDEDETVEPDYTQRSVGVHWVSDQDKVYEEDDEIELDLSSIVFSTNEPKPEKLQLELVNPETDDTVDLGSTDVDMDEASDLTDESGIAKVRATVPEIDSLSGDDETWELHAIDEENDNTFSVDVELTGGDQGGPLDKLVECLKEILSRLGF